MPLEDARHLALSTEHLNLFERLVVIALQSREIKNAADLLPDPLTAQWTFR